MKRNQRTVKVSPQDFTPLTERILAKMGSEGTEIRRRLRHFYQQRTDDSNDKVLNARSLKS